jgi:hypothetical protein
MSSTLALFAAQQSAIGALLQLFKISLMQVCTPAFLISCIRIHTFRISDVFDCCFAFMHSFILAFLMLFNYGVVVFFITSFLHM